MKLWKSSILFVSVAVMLLSSMVVSADKTESDPTGDVWHWDYTGGVYGWDANVGNRPNIDVTEISYAVSGTQVTLNLKVAGTISSSELIHYYVYLNTSDSTYMLSWAQYKRLYLYVVVGKRRGFWIWNEFRRRFTTNGF